MGGSSGKLILQQAPTLEEGKDHFFDYAGPGPWYTCRPDGVMPPRYAKTGLASEKESASSTLPRCLQMAAQKRGEKPALKAERPVPALVDGKAPPALPDEEWTTWTFKQWNDEARLAAKAFIALGYQPFDTINVWGFNSPEWMISAYAASYAGGKIAGLYPTDSPETAAYKVIHSGGVVVIVEDRQKVDKLLKAMAARGGCKRVKAFVAYGFEPAEGEKVSVAGIGEVPLLSWKALLELGRTQGSDEELERRVANVQPGHCAALVYTSGTTGEPKAVMISHDNIMYEVHAMWKSIGPVHGVGLPNTQERLLSYLPLSHVAGKMVDISCPGVTAAIAECWVTVYYARPYDLKVGSIKDRLLACKPTLFLGVPMVWEKIADRLRAIGAETTGMKKSIASWAKGLSLEHAQNCQLGGSGRSGWGFSLADRLVLGNIKAALGLDECKFGFTGAAPIRVDTQEYFGSLGLNINEVYGMSESTAAVTISTDSAHVWGSCGFQLPGVEVKAFKVDPVDFNTKTMCPLAEDLDTAGEEFQGELCFRGRNIMMGYMANPDFGADHVAEIEKKTAETIDKDGWLHSGDKGMVTKTGMVKITGRYKELIIGEGGENIAPVPIEDFVKKSCDGVNEVMMIGDKRKFNVALITLKAVGANGETPGTDDLDAGAKRVNPEVKTISAALDDKTWIDAVTAAVNAANSNGKVCPNNAFKIQKFTILPTNFSEEAGLLTPTKKLKRKEVEKAYAKIVDKLYASKDPKEFYVRYQE